MIKRKKLMWLSLVALLIAITTLIGLTSINVRSQGSTIIYIDPPTVTANPPESFTITISISDVVNLNRWEVKLSYHTRLMKVKEVTEGDFMKTSGGFQYGPITAGKYSIGNFFFGPDSVSGSGALASVTFEVEDTGNWTLDLYSTKLWDLDDNEITHTIEEGYFYTTKPFASFDIWPKSYVFKCHNCSEIVEIESYTPVESTTCPDCGADLTIMDLKTRYTPGLKDKDLTFDASASYDPDGGEITSYSWDFDDGNSTTVTAPTVVHKYAGYQQEENKPYTINLTVTDNEGEKWSYIRELKIWRDVEINSILAANNSNFDPLLKEKDKLWRDQKIWLRITAVNWGSVTESFNITLSIDTVCSNITEIKLYPDQSSKDILTYELDTSSWRAGNYTITANASTVQDESKTINNQLNRPLFVVGAYLSLTPDTGIGCTTLTGADFAPTSEITVTWNGIPIPTIPNNVTTSSDGNFTAIISVLNQTIPRDYTVKAIDEIGIVARATFTVPNMRGPQGLQGPRYPLASFNVSLSPPYYAPFNLTFDASASIPGFDGIYEIPIATYTWDFGDGNTTTASTPIVSHVYTSNSTYTVTLEVTDNDGMWDMVSKVIMTGPHEGGPGKDAPTIYIVSSLGLSIIAVVVAVATFLMLKKKLA